MKLASSVPSAVRTSNTHFSEANSTLSPITHICIMRQLLYTLGQKAFWMIEWLSLEFGKYLNFWEMPVDGNLRKCLLKVESYTLRIELERFQIQVVF